MKTILTTTTAALSAVFLIASAATATAGGRHHHHGHMFIFTDFSEMDTNGDGNVSKDEIEARFAGMFAGMDADGSGALDAGEFAAAHATRLKDRADEIGAAIAARRMSKLDDDDNGTLSIDEMRKPAKMEKIFKRFDDNDDGLLDAAEIAKLESKWHKRKGKRGWH